jgi:uncharacterized protein YbjQ (UPF0145 family)
MATLGLLSSCSTVSSSRPLTAEAVGAWTGPVFVTAAALPAGIEYKVLGTVKANHRVGYESADTLHPLLADEARKLGANAIMSVKGGRTVSAWSWAAAYSSGTAVRVVDPDKLKGLSGSFH